MVLDHVAERAGLVVVAAPPLDADRLGHGDLDVIDHRAVPQGLEQAVGEPQDHQVLDGFLAEIMVDPEDLLLGEDPADRIVDGARRGEIMADRLFQHDPGLAAVQAEIRDPLADRAEQAGRGREIEHPDPILAIGQSRGQLAPAGFAGGVDRDMIDPIEKAGEALGLDIGVRQMLVQGRLDQLAIGLTIQIAAGNPDDPGLRRQLLIAVTVIERRHQLAPRQITRAAEDHQVERLDGDDLCGHGSALDKVANMVS